MDATEGVGLRPRLLDLVPYLGVSPILFARGLFQQLDGKAGGRSILGPCGTTQICSEGSTFAVVPALWDVEHHKRTPLV